MSVRDDIDAAAAESGWTVVVFHGTDGTGHADFYATSTFRRGLERLTVEWNADHEPFGAFLAPRPGVGHYVLACKHGSAACALIAILRAPALDPRAIPA